MGGNANQTHCEGPMSPGKEECSSTLCTPTAPAVNVAKEQHTNNEGELKSNRPHSFPPADCSKSELLHLLQTPSDDTSSRELFPETPKRTSCVYGLFGRLPSKNEPDSEKAHDIHLPPTSGCHAGRLSPRETKYFLDVSVTRKRGKTNFEEVTHRFRWVPKNAALRLVPFQAVTCGQYSYTHQLDRDIYTGKKGLQFEEFEPLHQLARKYHKESEGVAWEEAVLLTKEAEESADAMMLWTSSELQI